MLAQVQRKEKRRKRKDPFLLSFAEQLTLIELKNITILFSANYQKQYKHYSEEKTAHRPSLNSHNRKPET
ncbi:MAG: hypothetical protein CFE24_13720 [Flavobacterium sp. BFFFF2]|nr:MAG: hypothetical protein CFE24_13720 [Flavobacterium sp. BFFFF2]